MKINSHIKLNIIVFIISVFITSSSIYAQPQHKPPKIPDATKILNMIEDLSKELSLSIDQQNEIEKLFVNHFADLKEKMESKKKEHEAEREKMNKNREKFEHEVKSLLNEEQQNMFDDFMKKRRNHHEKRMPQGKQ